MTPAIRLGAMTLIAALLAIAFDLSPWMVVTGIAIALVIDITIDKVIPAVWRLLQTIFH